MTFVTSAKPATLACIAVRHKTTAAIAVPVVIAAVTLSLLALTGNSWFLLLAGVVVGAFCVGLVSRSCIAGLSVSIDSPSRVAVGQETTSVLTVSNLGRRTSTPATVTVRCGGLSDAAVYVGPLRARESRSIEIRRTALRRGVFDRTAVDVRARPSLGLRETVLHTHRALVMTVHPRRMPRSLTTATPDVSPDEADSHAVARGLGTELLDLRDWQHGDGMRRVHWRATARHGRLVVVERGETLDEPLRVLLVGSSEHPDFEQILAEAAATCDEALRSGRRVTVAAWTPQGLEVAPTGSPVELLDWWAGLTTVLHAGPDALTASAVERALGPGAVVVAGPPESGVPTQLHGAGALPLVSRRHRQVDR